MGRQCAKYRARAPGTGCRSRTAAVGRGGGEALAGPAGLGCVQDELPGVCGAQGRLGEGAEGNAVQVSLAFALEDEAAAHLLGRDHVLENRVAVGLEAEEDERLTDDRVLAVERQGLQVEVGALALVGQALQLLEHRAVRADPAEQHGLVEDHVALESGPLEYLLATHPDPDEAGHLGRRDRLDPVVTVDDVPGVTLGLQKSRHHVHVPDGDGGRLVLKADELLVILGEAVGVLLPPAFLRGVLGEREQHLAVRAVDAVVVEQPLDLSGAQARFSSLVPADLRRGPPKRVRYRLAAPPLRLAQLPQLCRKPTAAHRGAALFDHRAPPPPQAPYTVPCAAQRRRCPWPEAASACGQHSNAELEYFTERIAETRDAFFSAPKVTKSSPRTCSRNNTELLANRHTRGERPE